MAVLRRFVWLVCTGCGAQVRVRAQGEPTAEGRLLVTPVYEHVCMRPHWAEMPADSPTEG